MRKEKRRKYIRMYGSQNEYMAHIIMVDRQRKLTVSIINSGIRDRLTDVIIL